MALIPSDAGLRLRLDNELLPQQITPVQEIATDLPRLRAGAVFTAQIRDVLPDKTYLALVAGKTVTLSLPESAKSGDILELVVVDQTPKTIIAKLADQPGIAADTAAYQHTTLSQTAQMLGNLLAAEGETPAAAPLNRGQPLLAQPPQSGADLVPVLSKAVTESGLFYEAHQAQWVAGKLPLLNLLQEPQGLHPAPAQTPALAPSLANEAGSTLAQTSPLNPALAQANPLPISNGQGIAPADVPPNTSPAPESTQTQTATSAQTNLLPNINGNIEEKTLAGMLSKGTAMPGQTGQALPNSPTPATQLNKSVAESLLLYQMNQALGAELHGQHPAQRSIAAAGSEMTPPAAPSAPTTTNTLNTALQESAETARLQATSQPSPAPLSIPDDLRTLVQQQLDAAGSQRLLWHGEVWPGQTMQWQLAWQEQRGNNSGEGAAEPWATTLRLNTPRLGELEASLQLGPAGVRIALTTPNAESAADMRAGAADLEQSLAAAGVPLLGFSVKHDQEEQE